MSHDSIGWLDRIYALVWREDDLDAAFADFPEDFEWVMPGFPGGETAQGGDDTREFFRDWIAQWDDINVDWELHEAGGDRVLALVRMTGTGRASGVPVEVRFAQLWSFRDGRPVRMHLYGDSAEGRRAAGL
jgi:ketosteroid isomerase-like protein